MRLRSVLLGLLILLLAACGQLAVEAPAQPAHPAPHAPPVQAPPFLRDGVPVDLSDAHAAPTTAPSPREEDPSGESDAALAELPVRLAVENYCMCYGPRGQAQVKLKPRVVNESGRAVSVSLDKFRLVVSHRFASDWTPLDPAAQLETMNKHSLVPANGDLAAERFDGSFTWASHWDGTSLAGGAEHFRPRVKQGDQVFFVPTSASEGLLVVGLALVTGPLKDGGKLIGFAPYDQWRGYALPYTF